MSEENVSITFVDRAGESTKVAAAVGQSLMTVATENMILGIDGDCGGGCACGTCRVFNDDALSALAQSPDDMEESLIEFVSDSGSPERLGCQINVTPEFEGLIIKVAC